MTLPALCSHLPMSRPRTATAVMPAITAAGEDEGGPAAGRQPAPGGAEHVREVRRHDEDDGADYDHGIDPEVPGDEEAGHLAEALLWPIGRGRLPAASGDSGRSRRPPAARKRRASPPARRRRARGPSFAATPTQIEPTTQRTCASTRSRSPSSLRSPASSRFHHDAIGCRRGGGFNAARRTRRNARRNGGGACAKLD